MIRSIVLNDKPINVTSFAKEIVQQGLRKVIIEFKVNGGEHYHEITKFLYKNHFRLSIPQYNEQFDVIITNYSTSLADFKDERAISLFHLELMEQKS